MKYAGFWLRFTAFIVDTLIILGATLAINLSDLLGVLLFNFIPPFYQEIDLMRPTLVDSNALEIYFAATVIGIIYSSLFESSVWQATPGKKIVGIKVVDYDGNRLEFPQALGRVFFETFSTLTLGIGYLMIAFTEKKQGLHDKIAKCLVIKD